MLTYPYSNYQVAEAIEKPTRAINLVYDDSGSMIEDEVGWNKVATMFAVLDAENNDREDRNKLCIKNNVTLFLNIRIRLVVSAVNIYQPVMFITVNLHFIGHQWI